MQCNCEELFDLYKEMFFLHVNTKTNDIVFHKASEGFYETLFSVAHGVAEAMQDTKMSSPTDNKKARSQSYNILEKAKKMLETMVESNKDIAMDNVLRWLVDKLWFECGTARWFYDGDKDSDVTIEKDSPEVKKDEDSDESETVKEDESEEDEESDKDDSWDIADYGMTVEVVDIEDEDEELSEDDMKKKMENKFKNKDKAKKMNEKMW